MPASEFTSLKIVKGWLGLTDTNTANDDLIVMLIKSASGFISQYINRSFEREDHTQLVDGYGNSWIVLKDYPVISVKSLFIGSSEVKEASGDPINNGWYLDTKLKGAPQSLYLLGGWKFPRALASIAVSYSSGYFAEEMQMVSDDPIDGFHQLHVDEFYLKYYSVEREISGEKFTYVKGDPGPLQYTVRNGVYLFNSEHAGEWLKISYSYLPYDVVMATTEIVGERYKSKDRIGVNSKSLGGQETVSFNNQSISSHVRELLIPYRRVF